MIPVNVPRLRGNELKYVTECIESGWVSSEGPFVERFERAFAEVTQRNFAVANANGTTALQLAVEALNLAPGDEVLLPSFTIISCASCLVRQGLKPVPVDCDRLTMNANVDHYRAAITPKTRALMVAHIYGLPVDMDPVLELAREHGLKVIEDAAEVIGQTYKGRPCGSFGDVSTLSFYPNKHVTTGEGGMVLTNDAVIAERCRALRNLAFKPPRRFEHDELGWNYRLTNVQAAIGLAQLEQLDAHVALKREIGRRYAEGFRDLADVALPLPRTAFAENIYWVYTLVLGERFKIDADEAMTALTAAGIGVRPFFWPMHEQPVLRKLFPDYAGMRLPNAEYLARKGFYIPSGLGLDLDRIPEICETVKRVLAEL